ncbi:MAG: aminotransferase class III-fold pyridoxal phosphate-dependent enzyme, partial [Desulfobacula sp.]|uniref:aminotransferase class III-fold pyridoxal phosphate-dependent enzyme n=1 Tax=Desulfobacula sp. TaxID=2593537 RepID=UPI0039B8BCB9|nr:aminotransferase class III-fold pyridoxal phosphate-dependent enzyme [Desulfobacula sp.]
MKNYKDSVLKESSQVLEYILKDTLTENDKDRIISDSIDNFNNHVNPGWLKYRKSVSTDASFVEWTDSQETFSDTHGNEFIDFISSLAAVTIGYCDADIDKAVKEQMKNGIIFSLPHELEVEVAEKLIEIIPCAKKVR